ncbi:MAG TPA: nucleotidyltransferase family protein [Candidatus Saccharimonadales bacterium]|nr:nucleotidyltransferase family protein [Candidatus Saccharimonadales bacterium]
MLTLIILAAGKSTRMHGVNKLLAKVGGIPMIRRVLQAALESKVDEVIVVLGFEANKIHKEIENLPCRIVINKEYEKGQSSSLIVGMKAIKSSTHAVLILPADIARIDTQSINLVATSYNKEDGSIVCAAHNGRLGHPILFSKAVFDEIMMITEETSGLKSLVMKHRNELRLVETGNENILTDVDTPDELRRLDSPSHEN